MSLKIDLVNTSAGDLDMGITTPYQLTQEVGQVDFKIIAYSLCDGTLFLLGTF